MPKQLIVYGTPIGWSAVGLTVFASMGGLLFGYDTGQIADIEPLFDFKERFGEGPVGARSLSTVRSGLIVGLLSIGTLVGALAGSYVADRLGRRMAMIAGASVVCVGIVIQITTFESWVQFAMGRFTAGLGIGQLSMVVPVYQSELAPKQIRGTLVATYQLFITFGILIAYCFGIGTREISGPGSWRLLVGLGLVFASVLIVGVLFMPESPRWLVQRGREEEAKRALATIRGCRVEDHDPIVEYDYAEMMDAIRLENQEGKGSWAECFSPKLIKRTITGILLQMFQQLTGANYFFYYGATIFTGVGISDSYVVQIILGAVNVITTFPGLYFLENFGRRKPLMAGAAWQSAWLFAFAIAGTVGDPLTSKGVGTFMIVATCMFIAGFASTWGPGIWIVNSELYPTRTRTYNVAMTVASNWLWNFLLAFFTPFITRDIGFTYGFVFAGCNFVAFFLIFFLVKEGAGLSLEQIQQMYLDPVPAWRSTHWVPPGFKNRRDASAVNETVKAPVIGEDGRPSMQATIVGGADEKEKRKKAGLDGAQAEHVEGPRSSV